jgi:hypothetical protein
MPDVAQKMIGVNFLIRLTYLNAGVMLTGDPVKIAENHCGYSNHKYKFKP